jgi:uroporphyrinogen decarboxylase
LARHYLALTTDEELSLHIGDDFRRVYAKYSGPPYRSPDSHFTRPGAICRTPFGVERHGYGFGQPLDHPLKDAQTLPDLDKFPWPDPVWMDVAEIRTNGLKWNGRYAVLGGDWSPFFHDAIDLLGMEKFMMAMYDNPALVDAVLGRIGLLFPDELADLCGGGRRHRYLFHRERLRHAERSGRRGETLPAVLPSSSQAPCGPRP